MCNKRQCPECGAESSDIVSGVCRPCYRRAWYAKAKKRTPPKPRDSVSESPAIRVRERDSFAAAWYSETSKVPTETQRRIFAMFDDGMDEHDIAKRVGLPARVVLQLTKRGVISPRLVEPYRCGGCGNKVCASPCFVCESRRMHQHSRKLSRLVS